LIENRGFIYTREIKNGSGKYLDENKWIKKNN